MIAKVTCIFVFCFSMASAGLIAVPSVNILEGPSTRTKVVGPDGSVIDAFAPGGRIVLDNNAGPLLQPAPLVVAQPAIAVPHIYSAFELQPVVQAIDSVAEIKADSDLGETKVRVSENDQEVVLEPEIPERVESRASVPLTEEIEETSTATTELSYTTEDIGTATPDLSGAYVQDNFEKLYDDGSYRSEHY